MICPECNGRGETIYYVETARDENSVTVEQRKGVCRTCNGSGKKTQTNADRIRAMSDEELANRMYWYHAGSDAIPFCKNLPECGKMMDEGSEIPDEKCIGCMLDWLKRPAEKI